MQKSSYHIWGRINSTILLVPLSLWGVQNCDVHHFNFPFKYTMEQNVWLVCCWHSIECTYAPYGKQWFKWEWDLAILKWLTSIILPTKSMSLNFLFIKPNFCNNNVIVKFPKLKEPICPSFYHVHIRLSFVVQRGKEPKREKEQITWMARKTYLLTLHVTSDTMHYVVIRHATWSVSVSIQGQVRSCHWWIKWIESMVSIWRPSVD